MEKYSLLNALLGFKHEKARTQTPGGMPPGVCIREQAGNSYRLFKSASVALSSASRLPKSVELRSASMAAEVSAATSSS